MSRWNFYDAHAVVDDLNALLAMSINRFGFLDDDPVYKLYDYLRVQFSDVRVLSYQGREVSGRLSV